MSTLTQASLEHLLTSSGHLREEARRLQKEAVQLQIESREIRTVSFLMLDQLLNKRTIIVEKFLISHPLLHRYRQRNKP